MASSAPSPSPATKEPFEFPSLTELKRSIPAKYFESSAPRSLLFTVRAFAFAYAFGAALFRVRQLPLVADHAALDALLCGVYIFLQGVNMWGFFTIGHDCGHGSFSRSHLLNFIVGTITHSLILTPYEAWKLSHRLHHKNTGNIDQDEIFYPQRKETVNDPARKMVLSFGFAWWIYEIIGFPPRTEEHTELVRPQRWFCLLGQQLSLTWISFGSRHLIACSLSVLAHLSCVLLAFNLTYVLGWATMGVYYWAPLFVFASMLVITTFLHHNDEETPWYADSEWTYVKGNLSSVDRDYGWLVNHLSHNIGTHQVHHLFPIIPHYNLLGATEHFRKAFPHLVRKSDDRIIPAFIRVGLLYIKYGVIENDAKHFSLKDNRAVLTKRA